MSRMKLYLKDLRERIVNAVEAGTTSKSGAARLFGVSAGIRRRCPFTDAEIAYCEGAKCCKSE